MIGPTVGVILAGGRAERMGGGDKGLRTVCGKAILARVIERSAWPPARIAPTIGPILLRACALASPGDCRATATSAQTHRIPTFFEEEIGGWPPYIQQDTTVSA